MTESEADDPRQDDDDAIFFDCEEPQPTDDEVEQTSTDTAKAIANFVETKKRRAATKTAPELTIGLPMNPQITKREQRRLKGIEVERKRKQTIDDNRAKAKARRAVIDDLALAHADDEELHGIDDDAVDLQAPHPSHDLRQMRTHAITYCNTCSHWAWHNKHSKLTQRCKELKRGNQTVLRLLQCDVVPEKGANVPAEFKKRSWGPGQRK